MRAEFDMRLNETYSAASATAEQVRHDWLARLAALEARAATDLAAADGERQRLAAEWAVEKAGLEDRHRSVQQCWATERENIALSRAADAALWDDERQSMLERALAREAALRVRTHLYICVSIFANRVHVRVRTGRSNPKFEWIFMK
jgi:hypothetical protein